MTALPTSGAFTMVDPTHVAAVGPSAALLFARVCWRSEDTGSWKASRAVLAQETGLSPSMLRTAVQTLREQEWLASERASADDATLIWRPILPGHADVADSAPPPCDIRHLPDVADSALSSIETVETDQTPPVVPPPRPVSAAPVEEPLLPMLTVVRDPESAAPDQDAEFAAFWEHYPRRVGKKAARTAWARARRQTPLEDIARGLMAQLPELQARETAYVPHPATWLNQGRWADEPAHAVTTARPRGDVYGAAETVRGAEELLASWSTPALGGGR